MLCVCVLAQAVIYFLILKFLASIWGTTNDNFYYDTDDYGLDAFCSSAATMRGGIWLCSNNDFVFCPFGLCAIYPWDLTEVDTNADITATNSAQSSSQPESTNYQV